MCHATTATQKEHTCSSNRSCKSYLTLGVWRLEALSWIPVYPASQTLVFSKTRVCRHTSLWSARTAHFLQPPGVFVKFVIPESAWSWCEVLVSCRSPWVTDSHSSWTSCLSSNCISELFSVLFCIFCGSELFSLILVRAWVCACARAGACVGPM